MTMKMVESGLCYHSIFRAIIPLLSRVQILGVMLHQKEEHCFAVLFFLVSAGHFTAQGQINCPCAKVFA